MPPWFDNLTAYLLNHLDQFYVNCDTKLYDCETNECIIFMKTFTEVNELNSMSPAILAAVHNTQKILYATVCTCSWVVMTLIMIHLTNNDTSDM